MNKVHFILKSQGVHEDLQEIQQELYTYTRSRFRFTFYFFLFHICCASIQTRSRTGLVHILFYSIHTQPSNDKFSRREASDGQLDLYSYFFVM